MEREQARLNSYHPKGEQLAALGIDSRPGLTLASLLTRPEIDYARLSALFPPETPLPADAAEQVETAVKYAGYIRKQAEQVERFRRLEEKRLPADIDYLAVKALSTEAAQKLQRLRPSTIGQAGRIPGVNPADINVLLVLIGR